MSRALTHLIPKVSPGKRHHLVATEKAEVLRSSTGSQTEVIARQAKSSLQCSWPLFTQL